MSNTIDWGKIHYNSWSPETNLTGAGATPSYQNEYSFQFDGIDDYIDCNSAAGYVSGDNEGTISLWINPDDIVSNQTIISFTASSQTRRFLNMGLNGSLGFYVEMKTSITSSTGFFVYADVNPFSIGTWTHLAIVQDGVSPQLYVNGVAISQTFLVSASDHKWINDMSGFDTINIGRWFQSGVNQNYFDGLIDEVSYFSSALSSTDIETIYNNSVPNNLNELSTLPTIWYRMGEAATFDGIRDWNLVDQGTGGNDAVTQNIAETERVTDVPT